MDKWGQPKHSHRAELPEVNTGQLHTLLIILEEGSVTDAAVALGLSQPAVSRTLRRMRDLTGDQLLVRSGSKLVPTAWAQEMIEPLRNSLASLAKAIRPSAEFDPSAQDHEIRIASADCMEAFFLPHLTERIWQAAPHARMMMRSVLAGYDYVEALERGDLDVVIANWPSPPGNLRMIRLLADDMVCLFGPNHKLNLKQEVTLKDYMELKHVVPVPLSNVAPGPIDGKLAELGLSRDIRLMAPEFNLIPYVLMNSDLVFTSSAAFARHYQQFLPIRSLPAPKELGGMHFYLLWHERVQDSPPNRWLRQQIIAAAYQVKAKLSFDPTAGSQASAVD